MNKARRCACGCGLPTSGGEFRRGHGTKIGRHWSTTDERGEAIKAVLIKRRAYAYRLLHEHRVTKHFSASYFRLYHRICEVDKRAELEVVVPLLSGGFRAIDVGIPALRIGWEFDPGNRYHLGTAADSERDQELEKAGWEIHHVKKYPPNRDTLQSLLDKRCAQLGLDETKPA